MKEKTQEITFAFAADPHVESPRTRDWLIEDLKRIKDVDFIVIGGDLTWSGSLQELGWYQNAVEKSPIPIYSVFGGHDGNELLFSNAPDATANFCKVLGNPWYAFDAGHARAICTIPPLDFKTPGELDYLKSQQWEEQKHWLQQEIERLPADRPLLMFQHMPTTRRWPDFLDRHPPLAVFMGHWHLLKVWQQNSTVYAAVPPIAVAGYSGFPRGYFHCTLTGQDLQIRFTTLNEQPDRRIFPSQIADEKHETEEIPNTIAWALDTVGDHFLNAPVAADERVYMAYVHKDLQHSTLCCVTEKTGHINWETALSGAVFSTPVLCDGQVMVMTVDGGLHAFNHKDGSGMWSVGIDDDETRWALDGFSAGDGMAYLRTLEHVAAIRLKDGSIAWQTALKHHDWVGPRGKPLIADARVFVPAVLGRGVTCVDRNTGEVLWESQDADWFERMSGGLALDQERDILFSVAFGVKGVETPEVTEEGRKGFAYGGLIAMDANSGSILWRKLISSHNYSHPVVAGKLVLLSDTVTGRILAFDKMTGDEIWVFESGPPLQCVSGNRRKMPGIAGAPAVDGQEVFAGAADGWLYQLDLSDGKVLEQWDLSSAVHATPVVSRHLIILPTSSGVVFAVNRNRKTRKEEKCEPNRISMKRHNQPHE